MNAFEKFSSNYSRKIYEATVVLSLPSSAIRGINEHISNSRYFLWKCNTI